MYVIECRRGGYAILHDIRPAELKELRAAAPEGWEYKAVSGVRAHRWVKAGEAHSTDLWVDHAGRIRKAGVGDGCGGDL